jgi:FkbM family methyltransferase
MTLLARALAALRGRRALPAAPSARADCARWRALSARQRLAELRGGSDRLERLLGEEKAALPAALGERAKPGFREVPPPEASQEHYVSFMLDRRLDGVAIFVPHTDRWEKYSLDRRLMHDERYPLEGVALRRLLASDGSFVDIGAHLGLVSIAHGLLGDFERIHAIEPADQNVACLTANVARNGLEGVIETHPLAIGSRSQTVRLRLKGGSGRHFVLQENKPKDPRPNQEARQLSLDDFMDGLGPATSDVTWVKSDTQGFEGHVLNGAQAFLARRQAIFELTYAPYTLSRRSRTASDEFIALLEPHFSHFMVCGAGPLQALPIDRLRATLKAFDGVHTDLILFP